MKLTVLVLMCGLPAIAADSGMELYQKAVTQERAGKMDEAIKLYQQVAHDFASDRALAAKALVQAARGYEKLGQDGAVKLYERVARDYADQRESAQAAQVKLASLRIAATPTMTMRKIEFGENVKNVVATDGQQALYWDDARTTLLFGDIAGKKQARCFADQAAASAASGHCLPRFLDGVALLSRHTRAVPLGSH